MCTRHSVLIQANLMVSPCCKEYKELPGMERLKSKQYKGKGEGGWGGGGGGGGQTCFEEGSHEVQGLLHQQVQDVAALQVQAGQAEQGTPDCQPHAGLQHQARLSKRHHGPQCQRHPHCSPSAIMTCMRADLKLQEHGICQRLRFLSSPW